MKKIIIAILSVTFLVGMVKGQSPTTVTIGSQVWMTENLNVSQFNNGDIIPEAKTNEEWESYCQSQKPCWCYYKNDPNNSKYGKLYNWYAVNDPRGLTPEGYHIPTKKEVESLVEIAGRWDGGEKLKSSSGWSDYTAEHTDYHQCKNCANWNDEYRRKVPCHVCKDNRVIYTTLPSTVEKGSGKNSFGFNAKPGGRRGVIYDSRASGFKECPSPEFSSRGENGFWWTSTEDGTYKSFGFEMKNINSEIYIRECSKCCGFSVRCIQGEGQPTLIVDTKRTKPEFDWEEFKKSYPAPEKPKVDCSEWVENNLFEENFNEEYWEEAAQDFVKWYVEKQPAFPILYNGVCYFTETGTFTNGEVHKNGLVRIMTRTIMTSQQRDNYFNSWITEYFVSDSEKFK